MPLVDVAERPAYLNEARIQRKNAQLFQAQAEWCNRELCELPIERNEPDDVGMGEMRN